jgi:hypothetical protein
MPGMDSVIKQLEKTEAVEGVDKCPPMNWVVDQEQAIV